MADKKIGLLYSEPRFLSTSISNGGSLRGDYLYIIYAHKNVRGAFVEGLSKFKDQRELLLDTSNQYRVLLIKDKVIVMEMMGK